LTNRESAIPSQSPRYTSHNHSRTTSQSPRNPLPISSLQIVSNSILAVCSPRCILTKKHTIVWYRKTNKKRECTSSGIMFSLFVLVFFSVICVLLLSTTLFMMFGYCFIVVFDLMFGSYFIWIFFFFYVYHN
jgi:hypothetical protein